MARGSDETPPGLRGRARAAWRRSRALELAMAGHDYQTIAERVGFANRGTSWRAVHDALAAQIAAHAAEYRALTAARLDALIAAHWEEATTARNPRSAEVVLKAVLQQSKLLGLDSLPTAPAEQVRTVVVGGTSEEYIAALRQLAGPARSISGTLERSVDEDERRSVPLVDG